jgi:hypothetical protein
MRFSIEEKYDHACDENADLRDALDNIITLWTMEASIADIENSIHRARVVLENCSQEHSENKPC